MDTINIVVLISGALNLVLGVFIYLRNRNERTNKAFLFLAVCITSYRLAPDILGSIWWAKLLYVSAAFVASAALYFSLLFPSSEATPIPFSWIFALHLPAIAFSIFSLLTDSVVFSVNFPQGGGEKILIFGGLYWVYATYVVAYFTLTFVIMGRRFIRSEGIVKKQILFFFVGSFFSAVVGNVTNLILPSVGVFKYNWFGQVVTLVMLIFIAYAITAYRLLNVRVIATELFVAFLSTTLLADVFLAENFTAFVFKSVIVFLAVFANILLLRSVWREVVVKEKIQDLAAELSKANEELKKLDEAKSEFISIASHQLRGPLTGIRGYLSMIRGGTFGQIPLRLATALGKVDQASNMLLRLVEDLLDLSKVEAGKMPYNFILTDLNEVVQSAVDTFIESAKQKHLDLSLEKYSDSLLVRVDKNKIVSIIGNVIDNAILYTDQGYIKVVLRKIEDHALVAVEDTGVGLSKDEKYDVFLRFRRGSESSKRHTGSLGLGLYIARKILRDHEGQIWADSPGKSKGSTFYISLPLA